MEAAPGNIDMNPVNGLSSVTKDWSDDGKLNFEYGPIVIQREPWLVITITSSRYLEMRLTEPELNKIPDTIRVV